MALLDQLQQMQVGQDPTSQGIAALPQNGDQSAANFAPPTTNDSQQQAPDIGSAVSTAAQSPDLSKGLLNAFADKFSNIGDKLKTLSPAASQGLLAAGLGILANNNGSMNLGQTLGVGGISGLNAYNDTKQLQAQQAYKQQQQAIALQQANEKARNDQFGNQIAAGNLLVNQQNANTKAQLAAQGNGAVARTVESIDAQGRPVTIQLGKNGEMVGQPILKSDPNLGPLPEYAQKNVNDAATSAASAVQTYQQTQQLAAKLQNADFTSGILAKGGDFLTNLTGDKTQGQQLRGQLAQFANSSILGELPPGSASDKDIALVRNGVPGDTANPQTWQAYISAVGNVQKANAIYQNAKAEYAAQNRGNLGPLQRDSTINGQQYPAGTSFSQIIGQSNPNATARGNAPSSMVGQYSMSAIDAAIAKKTGSN